MSEISLPPAGTHPRFIELLGDLDVIVWEMDAATWKFTYVSERAERISGYPLTRRYEEPTFWQDIFLHPDGSSWCVHFCSTATRECRNHAFLYRARKAEGSVIWKKDLVRVLPDADGMAKLMRGVGPSGEGPSTCGVSRAQVRCS
jgi:PAS domain-containing protein